MPLLQVWLYATRDEGVFEKRYDELCQILNIRQYPYLSLITRTLAPSLDELRSSAIWLIGGSKERATTSTTKSCSITAKKFHRDRQARLNRKGTPNARDQYPGSDRTDDRPSLRHRAEVRQTKTDPAPTPPTCDPQLVAELTRRGITEKKAVQLLPNLKPGQDVIAQLEHADYMVEHARFPITNPPGFYVSLIENNSPIPENFETSAKRKAREENEQRERVRRAVEDARQLLESEYDEYCSVETDRYIQENVAAFEAMKDIKRTENRERYTTFSPEMIDSTGTHDARRELQKQIGLPTLEEFVSRKQQGTDFFLKPVGPSPAAESAAVEPNARSGAAENKVEKVPSDTATPDTQDDPKEEAIVEVTEPEDLLAADEIREANIEKPRIEEAQQKAPVESPPEPTLPEPMMIELVSDPPPNEFGGTTAEQGMA